MRESGVKVYKLKYGQLVSRDVVIKIIKDFLLGDIRLSNNKEEAKERYLREEVIEHYWKFITGRQPYKIDVKMALERIKRAIEEEINLSPSQKAKREIITTFDLTTEEERHA